VIPSLEGVLTEQQLAASVQAIVDLQQPDGLILWTHDGHADPWNHVETAMALDVGGRHVEAAKAYRWLADNQRADGSWFQYYTASGVKDDKFDANTIAYVATGVWHHHLSLQPAAANGFLADMWPTVEAAMDWVLQLQQPGGEVLWARQPDGEPFGYALLTGSCSIAHALGCALNIARALGKDREDWAYARLRLRAAIAHDPDRFAPKHRWAMDWYYPVLAGVLTGHAALERLHMAWDRFVISGEGVRCVDDHPWVTTGETAECAIACVAAGLRDEAVALLRWSSHLRHDDGSYWTGLHVPDRVYFPADERTAYSAAAVVLAVDAIAGTSPASSIFRCLPDANR
jgi:hypothetical protein